MKPGKQPLEPDLPTVKRLRVRRSLAEQTAPSALEVVCPLADSSVFLQRCALCTHGHGLLVDPASDELNLQCSYNRQSTRAQQGG